MENIGRASKLEEKNMEKVKEAVEEDRNENMWWSGKTEKWEH